MPRDPNHLTPEKDGRFCKRVRGTLYHFGANGDRDLALREWLSVKDALLAGKKVERQTHRESVVSVKTVRDHFLSACTDKKEAGDLRAGTFDDYQIACDEFGTLVGWGRDPSDLGPEDFAKVRAAWEKRLGAWALDRHVQAVRTMFNYACKFRIIDTQPHYADAFSKSSERQKRSESAARVAERGERAFTNQEIRVLLEAAANPLRAMILLGLNGGMYSADIAELRKHHVKREEGEWVVDFARNKTEGVPWKFVLWPETHQALEQLPELYRARKTWTSARDPADNDRIFLTLFGRPWHRDHDGANVDLIAQEFDKVAESLWIREGNKWRALKRHGLGFGSLRHTHITAVGDHGDERAANRVTGHKSPGIKRLYDKIPLPRIKAVTDLARLRILGLPSPESTGAEPVEGAGQSAA